MSVHHGGVWSSAAPAVTADRPGWAAVRAAVREPVSRRAGREFVFCLASGPLRLCLLAMLAGLAGLAGLASVAALRPAAVAGTSALLLLLLVLPTRTGPAPKRGHR